MGRLTRDPELRRTQSGLPVCSFSVACQRDFKSADGERAKERKALSDQITQTEEEISRRLDALPAIVQSEGYPDVQSFTATYRKAEAVVGQYNREVTEWERMVQERQRPARSDPPRSSRSVREQLRRLQAEGRRQQPRRKVVDRDSR